MLTRATADRRILLTEDKDFGELVIAGAASAGVMLLRYPSDARSQLADAVLEFIATRVDELQNALVSVTPAGARVLRLR